MLDRIDALDFDMYVSSWSLDRQPRYLKNLFHSDGAAVHGSNPVSYTHLDVYKRQVAINVDPQRPNG